MTVNQDIFWTEYTDFDNKIGSFDAGEFILKNKPVSGSSSQKVWISSDSDTEEEYNINTDDPDISDSDMLESLSFSVCKLWHKRQLQINTDFLVTGWML